MNKSLVHWSSNGATSTWNEPFCLVEEEAEEEFPRRRNGVRRTQEEDAAAESQLNDSFGRPLAFYTTDEFHCSQQSIPPLLLALLHCSDRFLFSGTWLIGYCSNVVGAVPLNRRFVQCANHSINKQQQYEYKTRNSCHSNPSHRHFHNVIK